MALQQIMSPHKDASGRNMDRRRWLFVSQLFHPDQQATSQLFSDLFAGLAQQGVGTTVLCSWPRVSGQLAREQWQGVEIRRGGLRVDGKSSLWHRAMAYGSYTLWLCGQLLFAAPAGARWLVVTNPPFAPVIAWVCGLLRGRSYELFLLDVYPDGLEAVGTLSAGSLIARLWRWANRRAFAGAERIYVLGRDMERLCAERYDVDTRKLVYFPHWSATAVTAPRDKESTRLLKSLPALHGKFVVQYSGNMGLWHDIETIVQAAHLLKAEDEIRFLMIGDGMRRRRAEALAQELGLTNMIWLPYQPKETLDDSLACCDAALISQRAGLEGVAVPCKLYGILASGRAILAQVPQQSEVDLVVAEERCGWSVEPGEASALATAIRRAASDRDETALRGKRAFAAYQAKYTLDSAIEFFLRHAQTRQSN